MEILSSFLGDKHEFCLVLMFTVAQALTPLIYDCIEWSSLDIMSAGVDICNCLSLANKWCM